MTNTLFDRTPAEARHAARLAVLAALDRMEGRGKVERLVAAYNAGTLPELASHRLAVPRISKSAVSDWRRLMALGGAAALAEDKRGHPPLWAGRGDLIALAEQLFAAEPGGTAPEFRARLVAAAGDDGAAVPSLRTVARLLKRLRAPGGGVATPEPCRLPPERRKEPTKTDTLFDSPPTDAWHVARHAARLAVLATLDRMEGSRSVARARLVAAYNAGILPELAPHRSAVPRISTATVYHWSRLMAGGGPAALVDRRTEGRGGLRPWGGRSDLIALAERLFAADPEQTAPEFHAHLVAAAGDDGGAVPNLKTVTRLLKRLRAAAPTSAAPTSAAPTSAAGDAAPMPRRLTLRAAESAHWMLARRRQRYLDAVIAQLRSDPSVIREWFSAAQLAALRLPGLPTTADGIRARAARERWHCRKTPWSGRTGFRTDFHFAALPAPAFDAFVARIRGDSDRGELPPLLPRATLPRLAPATLDHGRERQ